MLELSPVHPLLYEINTRCWLAEIPDSEFPFWQHHGSTHIWLMGVWTLGALGRAWSRKFFRGRADEFCPNDIAGSPYAVCGYAVSRQLGGDTALAKFRRKLNARGIKLVLDFIPNHTVIDHPWVKAHSEFYVTSDTPRNGTMKPYCDATRWFAYGDCGHGSPWMDILQLDYRNPELRRAMIGELLAAADKCDGLRCDMAMLMLNAVFARIWQEFPSQYSRVLNEFWTEAIHAVRRRIRDFLFLAEVCWDLEARPQKLGFNFTYDKCLYDRVIAHDTHGVTDYSNHSRPHLPLAAHSLVRKFTSVGDGHLPKKACISTCRRMARSCFIASGFGR